MVAAFLEEDTSVTPPRWGLICFVKPVGDAASEIVQAPNAIRR